MTIKKRGHGFEREQGGIFERVWREESEGRTNLIMLFISQSKRNIFFKKENIPSLNLASK